MPQSVVLEVIWTAAATVLCRMVGARCGCFANPLERRILWAMAEHVLQLAAKKMQAALTISQKCTIKMRIFKEWAQFQAIFFENYENDALIPKLIPKMTAFSNQLGMPAIVNSKKQALFTWKVEDFKKLPAESAKFRRKSHVKEMLITLFTLSVYNMYAQNAISIIMSLYMSEKLLIHQEQVLK